MIAKTEFIKAIGLLKSKSIRVSYNILSSYYIILYHAVSKPAMVRGITLYNI